MGKFDQVGVELIARDRSRAGVNSFTRNMRSVETMTRSVSRLMGGLGVGFGAAAIGYGLRSAGREAMSFETSIARVHTMLDAGSSRYLPQYERQIEQLAKTYGEGTESLASSTYDILSASIEPAKAMGVLEKAVIAAKGGFTSAATATNATVGILNAYSMGAEEAGRVTDIMHGIVKRGVITFADLAQNIGNVTSLAAVLGVDIETVGATISTMTRAGINAELAITALKNILNAFKDPTDEAREAAAELGFVLDENSIKGNGLIRVMDRLRGANARQLGALMPSIRGLVGFAAQLKNADQLGRDYELMLDSAGRSQEAYDKVVGTATEKSKRLTERYKALSRELGKPITWPAIEGLKLLVTGLEAVAFAAEEMPGAMRAAAGGAVEVGRSVVDSGLPLPSSQLRSGGLRMNLGQPTGPILPPVNEVRPSGFSDDEIAAQEARRRAAYARSGAEQTRIRAQIARQGLEDWESPANTQVDMQGPQHWDQGTPIDWEVEYKQVTKWSQEWAREQAKAATEVERAKEAVTRLDRELETSIEVTARMADGHQYAADQVAYEQAVWKAYGTDVEQATAMIERHKEKLGVLENEQKKMATSPLLEWTDVARQGLDDLSGTLTDIAMDFKNAEQHAERFIAQLAAMALQEMIFRPMLQGLGAAAGLTQPTANAKGNVYGPGGLERFGRGGLFDRATPFNFVGGAGVLGEAGREGVFPLSKDSRGELGIRAQTAGAGASMAAPKFSLVVNNQSSGQVAAEDVTTQMTPDEYIIGVLLRDAGQGGPTRDLMRRGG